MVDIALVGDTEGVVPFTPEFIITNNLAGQAEVEVRVNSVLVDTVVVGPESTVTYTYTLAEVRQHVIHFLQTVGGGGAPTNIGFPLYATENDPLPDDVEPIYYLEVSHDVGDGLSTETRVPFPNIEPVLDAAEAIAAVYLTNGATTVELVEEITVVTRTPLGQS